MQMEFESIQHVTQGGDKQGEKMLHLGSSGVTPVQLTENQPNI